MTEIRIVVKNFKPEESVPHRIAVLKCDIEGIRHRSQENGQLKVTFSGGQQASYEPDRNGSCKVLVSLLPDGEATVINFQYQSAKTQLKLFYDSQNSQDKSLQVALLSCKDQANTSELVPRKLHLGLELVQCIYSEIIYKKTGFRKTFVLLPNVIPVTLDLTVVEAHELNDQELWTLAAKTLIQTASWNENKKFVAFTGFTEFLGINNGDFSYSNIRRHTRSNPALSAGALALLGTGCLYTWPESFEDVLGCFKNETKVDMMTQLDDSNHRRTYSGCLSTTLGSVCHELGHIFDLGHTRSGIMGSELDYVSHLFVPCAKTEFLPGRKTEPEVPQTLKKLTKIRPQGEFLEKYHQQRNDADLTYFEPNNLAILFHHKWLNAPDQEIRGDVRFEQSWIRSSSPLAVVEVRRAEDEMTIKFAVFEEEVVEFDLEELGISKRQNCVVFASDVDGNILKFQHS